jgi:KDO2-lipid IV(A) lauroyltransferase
MLSEKYMRLLSLFAPRYWGSWIGIGLLKFFSFFPKKAIWSIGRGLGIFSMKILSSRVKIAAKNIALCFPELSPEKQAAMVKESFAMLGLGILTSTLAWWGSQRRINTCINSVRGRQYLEQAKAQGKGVIILSAHFAGLELASRIMSSLAGETPINLLYQRPSDKVAAYVLDKARNRYFKNAFTRDNVREMMRGLKHNEMVIYCPDQSAAKEMSIFVPFMGVSTLTLTATSRFAKMSHCVILPACAYFNENGTGMDAEFFPPLENFPSGDERLDAVTTNEIFEKMIRAHPEQYMWLHRRFKVRPDGEPSVY